MYRILNDRLENISRGAFDFARRLVEAPSCSLQEAAVADLVEKEMRRGGFQDVIRDRSGNVIGSMVGRTGTPVILLNCHMDTVSLAGVRKRGAVVAGGKLIGPGAADCKGGLAAQVYAGLLLKQCLLPLNGTLVVAATVAEENGLSLGLRELVKSTLKDRALAPDFAILGEPTGLNLYYGHDGWLEVDIKVEGHDPFNVDDAVQAIVAEVDGAAEGAAGAQVESIRRTSEPEYALERMGRSASFRMACRMGSGEDEPAVVSGLAHHVRRAAGEDGNIAVEVAVCREQQKMYTGKTTAVRRVVKAWQTDPFNPMLLRVCQAMEAAGSPVHPGKWRLGRLGMGTAGSLLVNECGIPAVGYGPGLESQAHTEGEYVGLSEIRKAVYGTAVMVHSLAGIPVCGWTSDDI